MVVLRWLSGVGGVALVILTWISLINTLIVPRRLRSPLVKVLGRLDQKLFTWLAARFDEYLTKDRVLAYFGPFGLLSLLTTWLLLFLVGYALMIWALAGGPVWAALRESGSSIFTIGIASRNQPAATFVYFLAGATGLVSVALLIAYLPALYASFNRRETLVTVLQSRAGVPAWGPEILARHQMVNMLDDLPSFYAQWESWAADVAESHTTYPILIFFRSPHPLRSWVIALLAVLDSAAMFLALSPRAAPTQARLCLRMGFTCLRDVAEAFGFDYDPDPLPSDPVDLTYEEFAGALARLEEVGFNMERTPEEAWKHFRGWRVNYESLSHRIADYVVAPPAPWSGERSQLPGMAMVPRRPPDRHPDEARETVEPKIDRATWRLRG